MWIRPEEKAKINAHFRAFIDKKECLKIKMWIVKLLFLVVLLRGISH